MSFIYFGNVPASVPRVLDTTPCMKQMMDYEDCVLDANVPNLQVIHPNWPTIWPRMLTDGKAIEVDENAIDRTSIYDYNFLRPLTKKNKQFLWECEQERFTYKACLRELAGLKRTAKHTSWDTAAVSNITLT